MKRHKKSLAFVPMAAVRPKGMRVSNGTLQAGKGHLGDPGLLSKGVALPPFRSSRMACKRYFSRLFDPSRASNKVGTIFCVSHIQFCAFRLWKLPPFLGKVMEQPPTFAAEMSSTLTFSGKGSPANSNTPLTSIVFPGLAFKCTELGAGC